MRLVSFTIEGANRIGVIAGDRVVDLSEAAPKLPRDLPALLALGPEGLAAAEQAASKAPDSAVRHTTDLEYAPLIAAPPKIICIGRNYAAHAKEGGAEPPTYPEIFFRAATSLIGHQGAIVRPLCSDKLDYEAELVAVVGKRAKNVSAADALSVIAGYSIFNDATIRDYQRKSSQWTIGKNFDNTGALGPVFVSADELPEGAHGLRIQSRLNGQTMQDASTSDFIFPVADLVVKLSECMTLEPGDIIVTGTPAGVGYARTPPLFMKEGDVCDVEIEGIGVLSNTVINER